MKNLEDLKKDISKDEKLKKQFINLKSKEEAVRLARDMGYDISLEELENDEELNEDFLKSVAGGSLIDLINADVVDVKYNIIAEDKTKININEDTNKRLEYFNRQKDYYRNKY